MIYFIVFSILITLVLNICFVNKINNKTNRLTLYFCNIIFSVIFILLMLFCSFASKGINYLVDKQIEKLEQKVNEYFPNALTKEFDTTQIKTMLREVINTENSEIDLIQNIIYNSVTDFSTATLNIITTIDKNKNTISIKEAMINIKEVSLNKINPYINLIKNIIIIIYVLYLIISFILSLVFLKNTTKQTSGIVFGEEAEKISIGIENKN
ncbi:MAG: hypothetical protein IIX47_01240 [Spirochaetaceae bacterium]|nr:hypothetical protein [Spirochaetaceae bacterium]